MIVTYTAEGWNIVTQRAHGLLAAKLGAMWRFKDLDRFRMDTLIAIAEHDDVFNELERGLLINQHGGPVNFNMNAFDLDASTRLMERAEMKGSFIALLTAKHIHFTHGEDPQAKSFIRQLEKKMPEWMQAADVKPNELDSAYSLLEFCDAFSLIICQHQIPPEARELEISDGPSGERYSLKSTGEKLIITPWPFLEGRFKLDYECRMIEKLTFADDEEFRSAIKTAKVIRKELLLSKK